MELLFHKIINYDYTQFDCCSFKKNCRKNDEYSIFL